jgi:ketosteroid isomerase-like protein
MSQGNVELVRSLIPPPEVDLALIARDEATQAIFRQAFGALFTPDFECGWPGSPTTYRGLEGLRELWNDWLEPWQSYHTEVDELIDLGDRVLALVRDYGRRSGVDGEMHAVGASLWTLREGKVARVHFYPDRAQALEVVGLQQDHERPLRD